MTPGGRTLTTCVFDLDETLYPSANGVMQAIVERIRQYMVERLGFAPAEVEGLRRRYYQTYGTALRGLQLEHTVDAEDYLAFVHDIDYGRYLRPQPALDAALSTVPLEKVIFTNATVEHAEQVLVRLAIRRHFTRIVDLRMFDFFCKPDPRAYARLLDWIAQPGPACVYVEDAARNLRPAGALGMVTVFVDPAGDPCREFDFCIASILDIGTVMAGLQGHTETREAKPDAHRD